MICVVTEQANYFEKTNGSQNIKVLTLFMRHPWRKKAKKTSCFFHALLYSAHLVFYQNKAQSFFLLHTYHYILVKKLTLYLPNRTVQIHTDAITLTRSAISAASSVKRIFFIPTAPKYTVRV